MAEQSPLDDRLTCAHLQGELATNRARLAELGQETERRGRDSIGTVLLIGVAGAMFVDSGNTQKTESEALERRNTRLEALAAERGCSL